MSQFAIALPWAGLALAALFFALYLHSDNNLEPATRARGQIERYSP